jgi:hypothetical protein
MFNILSHTVNVNQKDIEIHLTPSQNGYHQENKQMLARMQGERDPYTLLVGISTSLATIEISIDFTHTKQNKKKPTV